MNSKMAITANMDDVGTMLRKRGLEPSGRVQKILTSECVRYMDKYTPMSPGAGAHFKNRVQVEDDGAIYPGPYAKYHFYGKLMVGRAPKKLTNKDMVYHGAPKRGPFWDRRMWADKKSVIMDEIAKAAGGRAGK